MASMIGAAARRMVPWREADWRILIVEGIALIVAGVYLLADGTRAEFLLGLLVGLALFIDGLRQAIHGSRTLTGRPRDVTLIRGAIGIATGVLVVALSVLQQITVVGVRIGVGVGGLAYGLLGLALVIPAIRRRDARWTEVVFDVLLVALSIVLLYRIATADTIAGVLIVTSWAIIGAGVVVALWGLARRPGPADPSAAASTSGGSPDPTTDDETRS